jgi:putative transposase
VKRIWREDGLQLTLRRRRKRSGPPGSKWELLHAEYSHHVWAIDFHFIPTMKGRTLQFLNVTDAYNWIGLAGAAGLLR